MKDFDEDELRNLAEAALSGEKAAMDYKDEGYLELVLKVLGQMCDGQNQILQVSSCLYCDLKMDTTTKKNI